MEAKGYRQLLYFCPLANVEVENNEIKSVESSGSCIKVAEYSSSRSVNFEGIARATHTSLETNVSKRLTLPLLSAEFFGDVPCGRILAVSHRRLSAVGWRVCGLRRYRSCPYEELRRRILEDAGLADEAAMIDEDVRRIVAKRDQILVSGPPSLLRVLKVSSGPRELRAK